MSIMKRNIIRITILISIVSGIYFNLSAQVSLGMYGGVSANKLNGDPAAFNVYKPHVGWNSGVIVNMNITEDILLSLQPGIMYSYGRVQTADTIEFPLNIRLIYRDSVDISLGVVNIPVLVKVITDNQRFEFSSGIEMSYLVRAKWDNGSEKINIRSELNNFNFAVVFGLGYRIPVKETTLAIELIYTQGIINQSRSDSDLTALNRIKTSGIRFLVSWSLPLRIGSLKNE